MAQMESIHQKLMRVRKPHVHITYEVETLGGMVKRELPFVVGVLGDYSGNAPGKAAQPLEQRKFVGIDRDNFNEVMRRVAPGLNFRAENTLQGDGSELAVQLKFNALEDFEPAKVVDQVDPLRKILETRNKLRDLLANIDRAQDLEGLVDEILNNTEKRMAVAKELGLGDAGNQGGEK